MIRSTFRNLMFLMLTACFGVSYFIFSRTQTMQIAITDKETEIISLNQELENARNLDVALTELDNLTITEQTATQLDILRHLGLEQSELEFDMHARETQSVGGTTLYAHNVQIGGEMTYESAMALADRLQNTKKIVLENIEVKPLGLASPNVRMDLMGKIYGLEKAVPDPATQPQEPQS